MKNSLSRREVLKWLALAGVTQAAAPYVGISKAFAHPLSKSKNQKPVDHMEFDVVLIGAGIMSATLATFLKELSPELNIGIFERLDGVALESSGAWNNAGTGHSALCELNYTPQSSNGSVDISKAIKVLESFEVSKQFWAYLVTKGYYNRPGSFINSIPHMSLVWGDDNIDYLYKRFETMQLSHLYRGMSYSEDQKQLAEWMPLVMKDRNLMRRMAASRSELGTDVNFGELTSGMFGRVTDSDNVRLFTNHEVHGFDYEDDDSSWWLTIKNRDAGVDRKVKTKFVFIGAGGGALPLLEASHIEEGEGFGGFPISGQFLICTNKEVVEKHHAKVYGKAGVGAPPMSVPHLDTRIIDGQKTLLFGPYAGFSTRFLKRGSNLDLFHSIDHNNIKSMLGAGADNAELTKYLIEQIKQSPQDRLNALREFVPDAKMEDWVLTNAGQRVQVIKRGEGGKWGVLGFGTEVVAAEDGSIAALLGASPGASTSVSIMLDVLSHCFKEQMKSPAWQEKLKQMIPSYGSHLADDAALTKKTRSRSHEILQLRAYS